MGFLGKNLDYFKKKFCHVKKKSYLYIRKRVVFIFFKTKIVFLVFCKIKFVDYQSITK